MHAREDPFMKTPSLKIPSTADARRVLFLPGASGTGAFWKPVAERLPFQCDAVFFDWPGLGNVPADPRIRGFAHLAALEREGSQRTGRGRS